MSFALSTGVSGLQAHQKMLDIAGNNLANVNATAFKASRITFSELLSETIKKASQPTSGVGGTNPQQMGSGVGVSGISPLMTQGNIVSTGNPLDMAVEGEGYFVLSDGSQDIYTRAGTFAVDANSNLVEPSTGYIVQRIGAVGESDGFQSATTSNISVPYDVAMAANATTEVKVAGNLSAAGALATAQTQKLTSNVQYTTASGTAAVATDLISGLDQYTGTWANGTITFSGYKPDGTALGASPATDLTMSVTATTTLQDVLNYLNTDDGGAKVAEIQTLTFVGGGGVPDGGSYTLTYNGATTSELAYGATKVEIQAALDALSTTPASGGITVSAPLATGVTFTFLNTMGDSDGNVPLVTLNSVGLNDGGTAVTGTFAETVAGHGPHGVLDDAAATLVGGKIVITDDSSGYSESDLTMSWSDSNLTMPGYFELSTVGGEEVKNLSITVYDSLGGKHTLSGALVRTGTANTWDMVLTSVTGNIDGITMDNRRIKDIEFNGVNGSYQGLAGATPDTATFVISFEDMAAQTIALNMGTVDQLNGLTQFAGNSTAVAREQDGYEAGSLSSVSVNSEGTLIGAFSNGIKKDIAVMKIALFQNTSGLESVGGGYFIPSANSGEAVSTQAMTGGAGSIHGGSLEKSNADVATEFVNMIQAQNGFQANARTIRVANEILRELTNLIR